MDVKKTVVALVLAGLVITAIPGNQEPVTLGDRISALLSGLPARSADERDATAAGILSLGPAGIAEVCRRLRAPGADDDSLARYGLDAVALFVTRPGAPESSRRMFVEELVRSLAAPRDPEVSGFLISLLAEAGKAEAVKPLAPFLLDEGLCAPAVKALVTIGGRGAETALLEAFEPDRLGTAMDIIPALGALRSRGAVGRLARIVSEKGSPLREAALDALAEIGAPESQPLLETLGLAVPPVERSRASARYLVFARRQFEMGRKDLAEKICRDLMNTWIGPGESHVRATALALLADAKGPNILNDLLLAAGDSDRQYRRKALELAAAIPGEAPTARWIARAGELRGGALADLIAMLGERGDRAALPLALSWIGGDDKEIRLAAVAAAARLGGGEVFEAVRPLLLTPDEDQVRVVNSIYLSVPGQEPVDAAAEMLSGAPPEAAVAIIEILTERKASEHAGAVLALAASENVDVRRAALAAMETLARPEDLPGLIDLLFGTPSGPEIALLQNALAAAANCVDDPEARADELLAAAENADGPVRAGLIRPLARIGGQRALRATSDALKSPDPLVRAAALYALSNWKDASALDALFETARTAGDRRTRALCLQGIARLVGDAAFEAARKVALLRDAAALAMEPDEKGAVVSGFGAVRSLDSIRAAEAFLDDPVPAVRSRAAQAIARAILPAPGAEVLPGFEAGSILKRASLFIENEYDRGEAETCAHEILRKAGFSALFNGKDVAGWKGLVADPPKRARMTAVELAKAQAEADDDMRRHWRVVDGELAFDGKGHSLCTKKDYGDFEMFVDWKIEPKGDSGIYLRGSPQVQIWDEAQSPDGSGGLYNNQKNPSKPLVRADRPVGEWNTFYIRMSGERVTVRLNGVLVTDNVVMENYWEREKPIYPSGQIELQAHSTPLFFKNIYLRQIAPEEYMRESGRQAVEEGFAPLFNGRDLSGWTGDLKGYGVEDGAIVVLPGASGNLYTEKEYADFVLRFEFKLTPGANNGIGIRAPLTGDAAYVGMEIQVLEDSAEVYANLQPYQFHGSIYGVVPAKRGFQRPVGEWNEEEISARGRRVKVTLNGTVIVDADIDEAAAGGTIDKRDHPGLRNERGHIGFLGHGSRVEFRNIRIKDEERRP
jgi:HEAT repeat protein